MRLDDRKTIKCSIKTPYSEGIYLNRKNTMPLPCQKLVRSEKLLLLHSQLLLIKLEGVRELNIFKCCRWIGARNRTLNLRDLTPFLFETSTKANNNNKQFTEKRKSKFKQTTKRCKTWHDMAKALNLSETEEHSETHKNNVVT